MSRIQRIIMKLRATILQIMDKADPAVFDLAILELCENHDRLEEALDKANKRIETLLAMQLAGSKPSIKEN